MKNSSIKVTFKDNDVSLMVNLKQNTLFYGINGRGKTRALKSIQLIHDLAATKNHDQILEILTELNLSELEIFNRSYEDIFLAKEVIENYNNQQLTNLVKQEEAAFIHFNEKLRLFFEMAQPLITSVDQRRIRSTLKQLELILSSNFTNIPNFNDFNSWIGSALNVTRRFLRNQNRDHYEGEYSTHHYFEVRLIAEEITDVSRYLERKIREFTYSTEFMREQSLELKNKIEQEKKSIITQLGKTKTLYISTDLDKESSFIFDKITSYIDEINNSIINNAWDTYGKDSDSRISRTVFDVYKKIERFNTVMMRYENIQINLESSKSISFSKNNEPIDFSKLSSGEKRLCILFLNLIFFEKNIYLIDEPEMSLSLNYQSKIVIDLLKLAGKNILMIATHAPYIFEDFLSLEGNVALEV